MKNVYFVEKSVIFYDALNHYFPLKFRQNQTQNVFIIKTKVIVPFIERILVAFRQIEFEEKLAKSEMFMDRELRPCLLVNHRQGDLVAVKGSIHFHLWRHNVLSS